jgi:HEAT repeat protein
MVKVILIVVVASLLISVAYGCTQADHINNLIQKLEDKNTISRQAAADELVKIGVPAVDPLVAILKNKDNGIRNTASDALARIGSPSVNPLITALYDTDNNTRQAAAESLAKIGAPVIDPLVAIMYDPNDTVRYYVVEILGKTEDSRAIQPLIWHLKDLSSDVRDAAAQGLTIVGSKATEALINAFQDPDPDVKRYIVRILGDTRDLRGIPVLIAGLADDNDLINQGATTALVKTGSPAVGPLINTIEKSTFATRCRIYYVLGEIKDVCALESLIIGLNDNNVQAEQAAATALVKIGSPTINPLINMMECYYDSNINCLLYPSRSAVSYIIWIFGELQDARSIPILIHSALDDGSWSYKDDNTASKVLVKIGEPALEPLITFIQKMNFRDHGRESIQQITNKILENSNIKGTNIEYILVNSIKQKNINIILPLYRYYITQGDPNSEPLLIEALDIADYSGLQMAQDYVNCGNTQLEQAARRWATQHGYVVKVDYRSFWDVLSSKYVPVGPKWGESK